MSDPGLQRIRDLIEASSLGTPAARRLRERTGDDTVEDVLWRMDGRRPDLITGRTYLDEEGEPVRVITRWGPGGGPRNVLIERVDGSRVVRPFRGLRRPR